MNEQEKKSDDQTPQPPGPSWESDLDTYPVREPAEDPRWAIRTVWIWIGFAIASLIFILSLLILGALYE